MLALSRKKNETIVINGNIVVKIIDICAGGTQVRLGIQAPKDVPVHRAEICERKRESQRKEAT